MIGTRIKYDRNKFAIVTAMEFKDGPFSKEEFKQALRKVEALKTDNGLKFPIGTVYGDVEEVIEKLKKGGVIQELEEGVYKCMIA